MIEGYSKFSAFFQQMTGKNGEIFGQDTERQHDFETAKKEFEELLVKYAHFGYETVLIPKISVEERVDFILEKLHAPTRLRDFISLAKRLLDWNKAKLTVHSHLTLEDIAELFASQFIVIPNTRNKLIN